MGISSDNPLVSNQVSNPNFPNDFKGLRDLLDREWKKLVDAINSKEGGLYLLQELATFKLYFDINNPLNALNVYRKVINFGALPNSTTKRIPHNISFNSVTRMTHIYGTATDPSSLSYIPLPFSSPTLVENVKLEANQKEIVITTGQDYSNYVFTYVVIEYTKG